MCSFAVLELVGTLLAHAAGPSPWRFAAMALPVPALTGSVWGALGIVRVADELERRSMVEALAVGFAGGSLTTITYGLMQLVGAPQANWIFVWGVYAIWWGVGAVTVRRRYS